MGKKPATQCTLLYIKTLNLAIYSHFAHFLTGLGKLPSPNFEEKTQHVITVSQKSAFFKLKQLPAPLDPCLEYQVDGRKPEPTPRRASP